MNARALAYEYLINKTDTVTIDNFGEDGEIPKYEMGHGSIPHGVELTEEAVIFYNLVSFEPGTATVEVERNEKAHRQALELQYDSVQENDDITVVKDRHLAEQVPGRTMWTESDGGVVMYDFSLETDENKQVYHPEIVQVFERVPFTNRAFSIDTLEEELTRLFDREITFTP